MTGLSFDLSAPTLHQTPMKQYALGLSFCLLAIAGSTSAQEAEPDGLGPETCLPTEGMKEALTKFDGLKPHRLDTVQAVLNLAVNTDDETLLPERIEVRDGDQVRPIPFDTLTRTAALTEVLPTLSDEAQLCVIHPEGAEQAATKDTYGISVGMGVRFIETPGTHTLSSLEDGLKDGRAHYRKMAGAMGFMVPKFQHIAVAGLDPDNPPRLWATRSGEDIGEADSTLINGGRLISVEQLKEVGADSVRIEGYYRLSPSPDAKAVERFMK